MVRALSTSLQSALASNTRTPAITLTVEDRVIHYTSYQTPNTPDAINDLCLASDNSMIRVQVTRSGFMSHFQFQRITDPSQAGQWTSWTTFAGSSGLMFQDGGCAVSNSGGTLRAFAQRGTGGNNLWSWTSTNNGVSWSGPVSVLVPPSNALLKGISSAGNSDVFFLYDVTGGVAMGCSFFAAGSWSALTTWTLPALGFGAGLAHTWNGQSYICIYSDGYTLASCSYTPASATWSAGNSIAPSSSNAIQRMQPRLSFADGLYTLTCVELDTGVLTASSYSYPRLRQSSDLLHWSNGSILHVLACMYGAKTLKLTTPASGSAGARYYCVSMAAILSTQVFSTSNATQYLDLSSAVLAYKRHEQVGAPARLEVWLDNAQGQWNTQVASAGNPRPLSLNATLVLQEGYATGTTTETIRTGSYRLEELHFLRTPGQNILKLVGRDFTRNLDLTARYQNMYSGQTLDALVREICARAGLHALTLPATTQMSQSIPAFVLQAGHSYRHALNELCAIYGLVYFLDQSETLQLRELNSGDLSVWSYQPEIELLTLSNTDQRPNHIVVSGRPPAGGDIAALVTAEIYDDAHLHLVGTERLLLHVDPKLSTGAQCALKATLLQNEVIRTQSRHSIEVPLNPALQLCDVLTVTDSVAPIGSGQTVMGRIMQIEGEYDAQKSTYRMHLSLQGV